MGFRTALFTARFWAASLERALLTFAQALGGQLAVIQLTDVEKMGFTGIPWGVMTSVAAFAGVSSFVTSLGKAGATKGRGPGLLERLTEKKALEGSPVVASDEQATGDDSLATK